MTTIIKFATKRLFPSIKFLRCLGSTASFQHRNNHSSICRVCRLMKFSCNVRCKALSSQLTDRMEWRSHCSLNNNWLCSVNRSQVFSKFDLSNCVSLLKTQLKSGGKPHLVDEEDVVLMLWYRPDKTMPCYYEGRRRPLYIPAPYVGYSYMLEAVLELL